MFAGGGDGSTRAGSVGAGGLDLTFGSHTEGRIGVGVVFRVKARTGNN